MAPIPEPLKERVDPWSLMTEEELRRKRAALRKLIDGDMLSDRSLDRQLQELAIIENELAKREAR